MQTKQFHVIPNTLFPCLPTPSPTSRPLYHQPSASRHPIIHTLTLQMSKPSQSSTPHHISNTIPRRLHKSSLRFLSFKDTPHIHLTIIPFSLPGLFLLVLYGSTSFVSVLFMWLWFRTSLYQPTRSCMAFVSFVMMRYYFSPYNTSLVLLGLQSSLAACRLLWVSRIKF